LSLTLVQDGVCPLQARDVKVQDADRRGHLIIDHAEMKLVVHHLEGHPRGAEEPAINLDLRLPVLGITAKQVLVPHSRTKVARHQVEEDAALAVLDVGLEHPGDGLQAARHDSIAIASASVMKPTGPRLAGSSRSPLAARSISACRRLVSISVPPASANSPNCLAASAWGAPR
jgi:hypothetical protein